MGRSTHNRRDTHLMGIKGFRSWLESQFPESVIGMRQDGSSETFDHVLIDMNQLLHVSIRKSRSDGHSLIVLMKELDACLQFATPTKSLVLAMDGPPSAAKLATQRKRRLSTIVKAENKIKQLEKIASSQATSKRTSPKVVARKKRLAASETRTLRITPATEYMFSAEQALLYWVWQRLSSRNSILSTNNVKVFISPSTVAGEGEVKLLEWIYKKHSRKGESIAILGGDSDLVLEGLMIPTASTHNVFILLPDGSKRYLCASLWEMTRTLKRLLPHLSIDNMMKVRTDLALLLIMNGNDYLPKLRGSSWHKQGQSDQAHLVDPDSLDFNLDFCIDFFGRLAASAPTNLWSKERSDTFIETKQTSSLQQLNNFVDAGYLPRPVDFKVVRDDDDESIDTQIIRRAEDEKNSNSDDVGVDDGDDSEGTNDEQKLVRLLLGKPGSEDFYVYEIWHSNRVPLQVARQKLAAIALSDLMDEDDPDEEDEYEYDQASTVKAGYEWEIRRAIEGKTDSYLHGLLWTLQTYQDGICADYGYNYGKRLAPTARTIVEFLKEAKQNGTQVGPRTLSTSSFTPPVNAGISCLAALPSATKNLVPPPYRWLPDEIVESIYASCMDANDNSFDMKMFEELCDEQVQAMAANSNGENLHQMHAEHDGRRIIMGDHYWSVVSKVGKPLQHPFDPPAPFSDRLSKLKPNGRIRVSKIMASMEPRPRSIWMNSEHDEEHKSKGFVDKDIKEVVHSDPGVYLKSKESIMKVEYKAAYANRKKRHKGTKKAKANPKTKDRVFGGFEVRSNASQGDLPPSSPSSTRDGVTAMASLKQLEDAGLVGRISWRVKNQSKTENASLSEHLETMQLFIDRGKKGKSVLSSDLKYEKDRHINTVSKQRMKHHVSSIALQDIAGPNWTKLSFKELKSFLNHRSSTLK